MRGVANSDSAQEYWDDFSHSYSKIEPINFQAGTTLFMLAKANAPGARVLDVGCGSGYAAEIVSESMLSREGSPVYVVSDFSNEMVRMAKQRLE